MTYDASVKFFILGLKEGLRGILKENESKNITKETKNKELDKLDNNCYNENCLNARRRLKLNRTKLIEACNTYKSEERTRNIHAGVVTAASVAAFAFLYRVMMLNSISFLWVVAVVISIAFAFNDSKSLITAQKKIITLNEDYFVCLEEFKHTINIVLDSCDPHCLQIIDTTIPSCN
jgi:hypothetical protein